MKVLDLFAGLGGWSQAFRDAGHEVVTLDLDPRFGCTFTRDILTVGSLDELGGPFDVVLASPPCTTFSVASIGTHWAGGWRAYEPRTEAARLGLRIAQHTFALIDKANPAVWAIENPRGVMRKVTRPPTATVWYCQLGETRAKPTDLWTNLSAEVFPAPCRNNNPDCAHERAPRGAKTGTQGLGTAALRSLIPYELSRIVRDAAAPKAEA